MKRIITSCDNWQLTALLWEPDILPVPHTAWNLAQCGWNRLST